MINIKTNKIGRKLLIYVFFLSSLVTLVTSSVGLFFIYKEDIERINTLSKQVEKAYLKGLSSAAWALDLKQVQVLLDGLSSLSDINYISLVIYNEKYWSGQQKGSDVIMRYWPVSYEVDDEVIVLGKLTIELSKEQAYRSLRKNIFIVILLNFIRTFFIAIIILFIVDRLITRHLYTISNHISNTKSIEDFEGEISLKGTSYPPNEIDFVASTINNLFKKLKISWEVLKSNESNYRNLFKRSNNGVLVYNYNKILFYNDLLLNMFSFYSIEDMPKLFFEKYLIDSDEDSTSSTIYHKIILPVNKKETKTLLCFASPTVWSGEKSTVLFFVDVSEKVRLKEKSAKQEKMLIQSNKLNSLGIMASMITHEINNPNQLIRMNVDILDRVWKEISPILDSHFVGNEDETILNIPYQEIRKLIPECVKDSTYATYQIQEIIHGFKSFIRPDSSLEKEICEVNKIIENVISLIHRYVKKSRVTVDLKLASGSTQLKANKVLLNQSFVNLLLNAIEACESDKGHVIITTKLEDNGISIVIEDNGVGIPADLLSSIFELFQSSKIDKGGTGIGLTIVYNIIRQHNGTISVESEVGVGSTFTINLPV